MIWKRLSDLFGWTRSSYYLMSTFIAICALIVVVWWPLAEEYFSYYDPRYPIWLQFDWLLLGIFAAMSLLIMARANIRVDIWIVAVGLGGGLVIESWGTQTNLWHYYTLERPPLWIIPAWPIASLSIDRLVKLLDAITPHHTGFFRVIYWIVFSAFYALMLLFVVPTLDKSFTWIALLICILLIVSPCDQRIAILTFAAGSGLGYFLELWGTTRECWIYYTLQKPPFFAVVAHGLAALAFWRTTLILKAILARRTTLCHNES